MNTMAEKINNDVRLDKLLQKAVELIRKYPGEKHDCFIAIAELTLLLHSLRDATEETVSEEPTPVISEQPASEDPSDYERTRDLFWHLYEATTKDFLPDDVSSWASEALSYLEGCTRVPYEPDVDDSDKIDELINYSYVATAFALSLQRVEEGYSEESRRAFKEAWRAPQRFQGGMFGPIHDEPDIEDFHSLAGLNSVISRNLFVVHALDGKWEEAIYHFAFCLVQYVGLLDAESLRISNDTLTDDPEEPVVEETERRTSYSGTEYSSFLGSYDEFIDHSFCQLAVDTFEEIKSSRSYEYDWRQLLNYCDRIVEYWPREDDGIPYGIYDINLWVRDSEGQALKAFSYWNSAKGWLEANLEPSELRDELRKEEDEKAEQRLKRYFFSEEQWNQLPERAQRSLVEADRVWYTSRLGNVGSALDHLRIATEEVLCELFWRPCYKWLDNKKSLDDPRLLDLHTTRKELNQNNKQPSLVEFECMLGSESFKIFCETLTLDKEQREFVLRNLPEALKELRRERRRAAHSIGRVIRRGEVSRLYSEFLGISRYGVLPRLIDLKLQLSRAQKA